MTAPGWYPDPAGNPGLERLWDGEGWTTRVRPVGALAPRRGRLVAGVVAVALLTVAGVTGTVLTRNSAPTEAAGGGAARRAQPVGLIDAPAYCTGGDPSHRATYPENGWLHGGGLSTTTGPWRPGDVSRVPFASDVAVADAGGATVVLAALRIDDIFGTPTDAVAAVETCLRARNRLTSGMLTPAGQPYPVQVPGATAAQRRDYELTGSTPGRVSVVVVDGGQPESLGLLITIATGTEEGPRAAATALGQLRAG